MMKHVHINIKQQVPMQLKPCQAVHINIKRLMLIVAIINAKQEDVNGSVRFGTPFKNNLDLV